MTKLCTAPGCTKAGKAGRYCYMHYGRLRRHGDIDTRSRVPFAARDWLEAHVRHEGDDCLIWPFGRGGHGYGVIGFRGRQTSVQQAMCTLAHGDPPGPKYDAAHSCGRGKDGCANPRHLRWATRTENMADQLLHGTRVRGEKQGSAKLTEGIVREIRSLAGQKKQRDIAARFGVSQGQVNRIIQRRQWAWLD